MSEFVEKRFTPLIKKYDRTVILVCSSIGVLAATYLGATKYIDNIVERAAVISDLKAVNLVQAQINKEVDGKFDRMDAKLDVILRYIKR